MAVDSSSANGPERVRLPEAVVDDLLADPRRRVLLRSLHEHDGPVTVTQLAEDIIVNEKSVSFEDISRSECQRVSQDLYERHLPKLTATAVVRYNSRQASIELDDAATQLSDRLRSFDDHR
jgi:DNA-binding transcriptional ArsR family regulator